MLKNKKFQKNVEDFTCENCGALNFGDGFTNHCHNCLWSKHVDINPGDREENCHGLMNPIDLINKNSVFYVVHKCTKCNHVKNNKVQKGDNFNELIKITEKK